MRRVIDGPRPEAGKVIVRQGFLAAAQSRGFLQGLSHFGKKLLAKQMFGKRAAHEKRAQFRVRQGRCRGFPPRFLDPVKLAVPFRGFHDLHGISPTDVLNQPQHGLLRTGKQAGQFAQGVLLAGEQQLGKKRNQFLPVTLVYIYLFRH